MTRIFLLLLIALMCAPVAFSQSRDYSYYEFYVGYAYQRASNNADTFDKNGRAKINNATIDLVSERPAYNGFLAEVNQNVTHHIRIVTSFGANFKGNQGYFDRNSGQAYRANVQPSDLLVVPRYHWGTE